MPTPSSTFIVIKVGGSLVRTGRHRSVLAVLARAQCPIVIVPGGGALADKVRAAQQVERFSQEEAHRRALSAMGQMAASMADLSPRFIVAKTRVEIERALVARMVPIWSPEKMMTDDRSLPHDWSVTSDALAARLAECLGASFCLLVKSRAVATGWSWSVLERREIVDPWFRRVLERSGLTAGIRGARELGQLAQDVDAAQ